MKRFAYILLFVTSLTGHAQNAWTVDECMQYAVMHNHEVRLLENFADSVRWQLQKVSAEKEKLSADTLRLLGGVRLWQ